MVNIRSVLTSYLPVFTIRLLGKFKQVIVYDMQYVTSLEYAQVDFSFSHQHIDFEIHYMCHEANVVNNPMIYLISLR